LSEIARPDIAVIAAIGPGHLSEFGSVDDVAKAKWEIVDGLRPGGIVVAPGESPYTEIYRSDYPVVTFGMDESNDYHPVDFHHGELDIAAKIATPEGLFETLIPGSSQADLSNTLCAAAVCNQVRVAGPGGVEMLNLAEISHKLRTRPGIEGREELIVRPSGVEVVFDAYNSNPMSLLNALCSLARRTHLSTGSPIKRHVAILGDMLELGKNEQDYHRHAGREVGELRIDVLLTVGKLAELIRISAEETRGGEISGAHYPSTPALVGELSKWVRPGDLVLIKASRAIALEGLLKGDW
jgi:UDP-N-acetylmuramoyl-tripeptide--D-alanyl-D-alanine ligase